MGFWSGFEGLTGHKPGAFKGFSLKDIIDDDLWKRHERLGGRQSRQFEETGVVPTTAWYKGMGRPEMMGPRVGAAETGVRENRLMDESPDMFAGVNQGRFDATTLANQQRRDALWGSGPSVAHTSAARPWANIQSQMLRDPRQGVESMRIPTEELTATKKTVSEVFADPNKSNKITETIEEKVPTGSAQWGNVQHPPNWQQRFDRRPVTFSSPMQPEGALTSSARPSIMNMFNMESWQDIARRKWEERMRARRGY